MNGDEWEDMVIFLNEKEAKQASIKWSNVRIEIFSKSEFGYLPTYLYYQNGEIFQTE
jgi:hypothetical protein